VQVAEGLVHEVGDVVDHEVGKANEEGVSMGLVSRCMSY
jgi:hypothetical protein